MVEATPSAWWRSFIALGSTTGLRVREMLWLAWSDIDQRTRTVTVSSCAVPVSAGGSVVARPILPISRERVVPVPAETLDELNWLRNHTTTGSLVFVPNWKLDQLWPSLGVYEAIATDKLSPGITAHFRYVQRCGRLKLAQRLDEPMERVAWPVRPLASLRSTYVHCAAERYSTAQLAEYLGLASGADLPALLAKCRVSVGAPP